MVFSIAPCILHLHQLLMLAQLLNLVITAFGMRCLFRLPCRIVSASSMPRRIQRVFYIGGFL